MMHLTIFGCLMLAIVINVLTGEPRATYIELIMLTIVFATYLKK